MERKVIESVRDCPTVRRWIATVNDMYHLSDDEWEHRLRILDEFCDAVAADPERMIKESRASRDVKNEYMRRLKRFVRERDLSPRAAHDAENVVRSFFIHNGARVFVRPYQ